MRGDTKGGLLTFSPGQKGISVPPSLPFTPTRARNRRGRERMRTERSGFHFQTEHSGPIRLPYRLGFYTLWGKELCEDLRREKKKANASIDTEQLHYFLTERKSCRFSSQNDSQPKKTHARAHASAATLPFSRSLVLFCLRRGNRKKKHARARAHVHARARVLIANGTGMFRMIHWH